MAVVKLSVSGITLLSTIAAVPAAIGTESVAAGIGILALINKSFIKSVSKKIKKHEQIRALSQSQHNLVSDLVSKALSDNSISDQEFHGIISEYKAYQKAVDKVGTTSNGTSSTGSNSLENEVLKILKNKRAS